MGGLPKGVFDAIGDDRKKAEHYLNYLITSEPNDLADDFTFWSTLFALAVFHGNGYAWIERDSRGKVLALYNLLAGQCAPFKHGGKQWYALELGDGTRRAVADTDILHLRGLSMDSERGLDVLSLNAQSLGIARNIDGNTNTFFEQGAQPSVVIESDKDLKPEHIDSLKTAINANHVGIKKAHKVMILANGAKAKTLSFSPEQLQLTALKEATILDIGRLLGLPPFVLFELGRATWNNTEQLKTVLVQFCLQDWAIKAEKEATRKLLTREERKAGRFIRFNLDGLLRGDYKTRTEAHVLACGGPYKTPNEARKLEDLPSLGPAGDVLRILATSDASNAKGGTETAQDGAQAAPEAITATNAAPNLSTYSRVIADALNRVQSKQDKAVANAEGKQNFTAWLNVFAEQQGKYLAESLMPVLTSVYDDEQARQFANKLIVRYSDGIKANKGVVVANVVNELLGTESNG